MRFAMASVMLLGLWANQAAADLYRWVDPESGSVKFSSYPPPWFGDAAKQRRAPKVEVIPARHDAGMSSEAASAALESTRSLAALEVQRKQLMEQLSKPGGERGSQAVQKQLEAYSALSEQMEKLDPAGATLRRAEVQVLIEKILKGESR